MAIRGSPGAGATECTRHGAAEEPTEQGRYLCEPDVLRAGEVVGPAGLAVRGRGDDPGDAVLDERRRAELTPAVPERDPATGERGAQKRRVGHVRALPGPVDVAQTRDGHVRITVPGALSGELGVPVGRQRMRRRTLAERHPGAVHRDA